MKSWGEPLSIQDFLNLSTQYALSLNKIHLFSSETVSYDWLYSFLSRHDNLRLKKSRPLDKKRASLTLKQVDNWFKLLDNVIKENRLEDRPANIFNCDESGKLNMIVYKMIFLYLNLVLGLSDSITYSKVIVHRNTANPYRIQGGSGGKAYTTVMFCASATGFLLPPFIVYKSKRLYQEWCLGGPPDSGFDNSDK